MLRDPNSAEQKTGNCWGANGYLLSATFAKGSPLDCWTTNLKGQNINSEIRQELQITRTVWHGFKKPRPENQFWTWFFTIVIGNQAIWCLVYFIVNFVSCLGCEHKCCIIDKLCIDRYKNGTTSDSKGKKGVFFW